MYGAVIDSHAAFAGQVRVRDLEELAFRVKESEVLTGRPGRAFLVAGEHPQAYRVECDSHGCRVARLDADGTALQPAFLRWEHFDTHRLGSALRQGRLFTPLLDT